MKAALLAFERTLQDLTALLERDALEEELLAFDTTAAPADLTDLLGRYRQSVDLYALRQARYATQLVLLYGAFERAIEGLLAGFADAMLDLVPTFSELPARIIETHRRKSLDALRDEIWLGRQANPSLAVSLIENLASCEAGQHNFRLNSLAYARHAGNYRLGSINDSFRDLGIEGVCGRVAVGSTFGAYVSAASRQKGLLDAELGAIDDLAERRNEVAHGEPAQLLTNSQLLEYIAFFASFCRGLYITAREELARHLVAHDSLPLGHIAKVNYRTVVCLDLGVLPDGTRLEVGDPVAMFLSDSRGYELGEILTIRTQSGDVDRLRTHSGLQACLSTSIRLREARALHLIDRDAKGVWLAKPLPPL